MQAYQPDMAPLLAELSRHVSETDPTAITEILAEIEERLQRFGRGLDQ